MWQVTVDKDICTGCGECVEVCRVEVCEAGAITAEEI